MTEIREQVLVLSRSVIDERDVATALGAFDPVWESLSPKEQARIVQLLVKRIDYDGESGTASLTFHPNGLRGLAAEARKAQEVAA